MNVRMYSRPQSVLGKAGSIVVSVAMIATTFGGALMPLIAEADSPSYTVGLTASTFGPFSITLTGNASATHYTGNLDQQHVHIDWGDASSTDPVNPFDIIASSTGKNFTALWGPTKHTYTATGTTTIKIAICHQTCTGAEGADAVITRNVIIPPATLTVIKHVINTGGGTKTASDFMMHVTTTLTATPASFPGAESPGTAVSLNAGTSPKAYSADEDSVDHYTKSFSGDCSSTIATGQSRTCTITNTFGAPTTGTLVVKKHVDNTGGGTAVAENFTMHVKSGGVDVTGSPQAGSEGGTSYTLAGGSYTVSETGPIAHYTPAFSGDCNGTNAVAVTNGATATCTLTNTFFNAAPVAQSGSVATDEDTATSSTLVATDADSDPLLYSIVTNALHGIAVVVDAITGAFTYTPDLNYNGPDSFTFSASDPYSSSNTGAVSVTVNPVNDAPVAHDDSYSTNEDTPLSVPAPGVLTNDTDADGDTLTAVIVSNPSNGVVSLGSDGSFTYTPNANFNGTDTFTYKANDGSTNSAPATVTITVSSVNDAPVANNDSYSTNEDTALTVDAPGVLGNDTDADGNTLMAIVVDTPSNGSVALNSDGSFTYTPNANFNGTDTFTYKANDSTVDSGEAIVTITVNPVNDAPVAQDQSVTAGQNTATSSVLVGSDVEGDSLTYAQTSDPTHGTITFFDASSGAFTYKPDLNYSGPDSFSFKANDGSADSNTGTVAITVNPLFENTQQLCSDGIDNDNDGLTNLQDPDCAAFIPRLSVHKVTDPASATTTFSVTLSGTPVSGEATQNIAGGATVDYTVNPGTYSVSEATTTNWSVTSNTCTDVVVGVGETKDCTITNTELGRWDVFKHVINDNGGTATSTQFSFNVIVDGDTAHPLGPFFFGPNGSDPEGKLLVPIAPGHRYQVVEVSFPGYTTTIHNAIDEECNLVINAGQIAACNITNDDIASQQALWTVIKHVINDNGGTAKASDFSFTSTDSNGVSTTLPIVSTTTDLSWGEVDVPVPAGHYSVVETGAPITGYTTTYSNCDVVIPPGGQANCVITNDDIAPAVVTPSSGGGSPSTSSGSSSGGGGGGNGPIVGSFGGRGGGFTQGQVLGAASTTLPELPLGCTPYIGSYMREGKKNNKPIDVRRLQQFLNDEMQANLPLTGFFGRLTDKAVRNFQAAHAEQILAPWGLNAPTGFVYKTTQRWINLTQCTSLSIPLPTHLTPYHGEDL